ncbi:zf-HC2 domain-containing protein [Corynebacterium uberis]|uniref:zf-HC2 domain-containing protein n=1 Tax=Corynebacterium TaxID=1716 RepID=UPI001D0A7286|nr:MULTISPECIES: zf-HC2 domain-containing protein [Corynebacterium]MCZ9308787.1 zf-HC2 domain-containing protein [Corynebacterium sp. c6VSa_13]UDL72684.1 zf-HC2 domain-containing protein [Corynebacterium uberis]UDL76440.1 zf-HC2 domain-containing protein [Corynebacterium uberis]UDL78652.1 zf-HC2 domain-containing protein [Corynebacterium uberis]UDL80931.1 zf-HC2 domain-containing protein [Corynebacterium uberis]
MIDHHGIQAEISARLDGEPGTLADDVVEAHLAQCPECQAFYRQAVKLQGLLSAGSATPTEVRPHSGHRVDQDLTASILAEVEPLWRRQAGTRLAAAAVARLCLGIIALAWIGWAIMAVADTQGLLATSDDGSVLSPDANPALAGVLIDVAALRFGVGAALGFGTWKPRILIGFLPLCGAVTMFSFGFAMRDIILGQMDSALVVSLVALFVTTGVAVWAWVSTGALTRLRMGLVEL